MGVRDNTPGLKGAPVDTKDDIRELVEHWLQRGASARARRASLPAKLSR